MSTNERPGVYTSYEIVSTSYSPLSSGVVGVAAKADTGVSGEVYEIKSAADAEAFGADMAEIIRVLFANGASGVKAVPLIVPEGETEPAAETYGAAFSKLCADEQVKLIVCGSRNADVHALLKAAVSDASGRNAHKIGIVEPSSAEIGETVSEAQTINCERIVMVSASVGGVCGLTSAPGCLAAALAGAILASPDAATPINGAVLHGLSGTAASYTDGEITTLVRGGVTPVEAVGGEICAVRGITTRTLTGSVSDPTYREITTVLVIDDVVPGVRDALRASFMRAKNSAQTRGAIRSRVVIELEKRLEAGIIESYSNVTAATDPDDATVCDVTFDFAVAHGLNRIIVTAHITV